ncbi:ATP-grasp domain-containing protein [Actinomadura rayongensis]|uniref:ATP-grasp domain-containing protein n=1 Tax=Actinomadura rayongensis TaxID=1429076 RepID=A0A6I4WFF3_9ACTN|nr:ATP-grasp domain-containing protein [Actinomadura rayongensis]MXQ65292.1 ATP-grasp domain-containing protein [Actinomadura rayongensis]
MRAPVLDPELPVLLLRTDPNPFHHGTLGAIRSFGRRGVAVHADLAGRPQPAAASRYLRSRMPGEPSAARPGALLARLAADAERIGRRALLVPLDDAMAIFTAEHASALAAHFVLPPSGTPRRVADKAALTDACERRGIAVPECHRPGSRDHLDELVAKLGLPLIAKWARPWLLAPGARSTTLVRSAEHAERLFAAAGDAAGPLLLQRLVPPGGDWFYQAYFDGSGVCLFSATGRKHVAYPEHTGHTVAGEWVHNPKLDELATGVAGALGCRGVVDLDFRYDAAAGVYRLLDVNPRLGAQFRLFTDGRGLDLAAVLHLDASGRAVPPAVPRPGRTLVVENQYLRRALRTPGALGRFRELTASGETAWFDRADPGPFFAMARASVARVLTKGLK